MPLEGDLKSFNLASIFQLISQDRLTGALKIKRKNELIDIGFYEGQITGAFYERGEGVERLEQYLVKSGFIKKNLFEMIKEIHQETKRPVMNIILEDKYLTPEEVDRVIRFKIQEVIDVVFTWQEGEFKFDEGSIIYPKSIIKIRLNTESVVLETARRFDEWPRIIKAISSGDLVYRKIERPELKLRLPEDQERVLSLIDDYRSVDDLVEISGLGKFHTYSCLYHLQTTGQIELAYAKPTVKQVRPPREFSFKILTTPITIVLMIVIIIVELLIGNYLSTKPFFSFKLIDESKYIQDYSVYQNIFFYHHNRLPSIQETRNIFER